MKCQIYNKFHHNDKNHWKKFDYSYQDDDTPYALEALNLNESNEDTLYSNYGATSHMVNDQGKLTHDKKYNETNVIYVGDNKGLPISCIGNGYYGKVKLNNVLIIQHSSVFDTKVAPNANDIQLNVQ